MATEKDGWNYVGVPQPNGDQRKIVTLKQGGMTWVGIRIWNGAKKAWFSGNEPEIATVTAWKDIDQPARGFWDRGRLVIPHRYPHEEPADDH